MNRLTIEENFLDHAQQQALKKGLYEFPIFDADCHYFATPFDELALLIEEPWRHRLRSATSGANRITAIPHDLGDRTLGGRTKVKEHFFNHPLQDGRHIAKEVSPLLHSFHQLAIDYGIVFPTDLLTLGLHPQSDYEVAIAFAYARWMTEKVLPSDESLKTMLYLPFSDPEACVRLVREFADKKGVVGFMVTSVRYQPVHHNAYMPLYQTLEETGKPLGFHTVSYWMERPFQQLNKFMSAHALGFPLYNMIQVTNLVVNGIPERFPDLKFVFIEAGVTWIPFVMARLDSDYLQRSSEAPLLRKKPSAYIKNFYFTSQPLEGQENMKHLAAVFDMFDAENQLLYASDYPHQDFDTPSTIYDLPFLSETAKRKILGGNALKLFGIEEPKLLAKRRFDDGRG
ncbi:amidohydrolase [Alicyclobacillus curvatus]|nr:amidohydrolase [Alicyclobacillus curvatus]